MNKKVIICGKSGSGKDFLLKEFIKLNLKYQPKFTTRPKRLNEVEGVDYNFITNKLFEDLNNSNQIKVYQRFNIKSDIWYYGISNEIFENNKVFIMTPFEISQLDETDRSNSVIVYLDIDKETRKNRISERNDNNDDVNRRINADEVDFYKFVNFDLCIKNPNFKSENIYSLIYERITTM